jgi:hypothetical protein
VAAPSRHVVASRRSCPAQRSRAGAKGQAAGHSLIPGGLGKSLGSSKKTLWILINGYLSMSYSHTHFFEVFCVNVWGRYLVGGFNHLEKYESQWEGLSHMAHIYIMENNPHVPNHQPDNEIEYPWDPLDENPNGLWSSKSNTQNGVMKNCGSS